MKKLLLVATICALISAMFANGANALPIDPPARGVEPVVITGAQLPTWSHLPAEGLATTHPQHLQDGKRDAHNGTLVVPTDARPGATIAEIAAFSWDGSKFVEIPVQVDERFPYFLANVNSNDIFGPVYSGTDEELTYEWDIESWKQQFTEVLPDGSCIKRYANSVDEIAKAVQEGWMSLASSTKPDDMLRRMQDPVGVLDDDDEIVFMASDTGQLAPADAVPPGTIGGKQQITVTDPRNPADVGFVYLVQRPSGSSFNASNGYVSYERDADADEWIDRDTYADGEPENVGSSNTSYGPNIPGTVCTDDPKTPELERGFDDPTTPAEEAPRHSDDRFPRDGVTVSTGTYKWHASGRWMIRSMQIISAATGEYGPDLIDRWKGRAFQQSPDSSVSLVGFEDEQVNWEGNSTLLGERFGPVRAIREVWGADSGTNVTKTETFYRDAISYRFRVRVHPIPPDGLYTSWDYNQGVAQCYFNESHSDCVHVDGVNDDILNVDEAPTGQPAFFDATDPQHSKPLANLNWEQVSGAGDAGSLVYMFEMKNAQSAENPLVVPYYRDDACLDDGTGDNPTPRQFPGEASTDARVYSDENRDCTINPLDLFDPNTNNWQNRQGCFACHGIHYFVTNDTDNATMPKPTTEIDGQQWQWAVPTAGPSAVGDAYANTVKTPLVAVATYLP
ncbi:MAG: hypothetical protein QOG04_1871 [Actinomycetota bacterium]|jgi:hypothetical protein|nr:hypothetical protein [Actinomycetota bacterium]